jgi:hypothetical protein
LIVRIGLGASSAEAVMRSDAKRPVINGANSHRERMCFCALFLVKSTRPK